MKLYSLLTVLGLILATGLRAQDSLSLDQAIELALANNFNIRLMKNETAIAELNNTRANAGMLPVVTLNAGDNLTNALNFRQKLANGTELSRPFGLFNSFNANVSTAWTFYDGGRMYLEKKRLETLSQQGAQELVQQLQQTIAETSIAWYAVARQQETLRNIDEVIAAVNDRLQLASRRLDAGLGNKSDVLQAQIDLNDRRKDRIMAENAFEEARRQLNVLLAREPGIPFFARKTALSLPEEPNVTALQQQMLASNPALSVLETALQLAQIVEHQTQALNKPRLGLTGAYSFQRSDNTAGFSLSSSQHGPAVGVNFSMPLYTGGNLSRQAEVARVNVESASLRIEQAQHELVRQLLNLAGRSKALRQSLTTDQQSLAYAREYLMIATERFRQGQSIALEIREAQLALENALYRVNQTMYDLLMTDVQLRALLVQ